MRFLVWADRDDDRLDMIRESAASHGMEIGLMGLGRVPGDLYNNLFKQRSLYEALQPLEDDEIVCATDAHDVFFQSGPDTIRQSFLSFGRDVVFSAEKLYSHQYRRFRGAYDRAPGASPYRYLNAGGVIGFAGALRRLYKPRLRLRAWVRLLAHPRFHRWAKAFTPVLRDILPRKLSGRDDFEAYMRWYNYADQAAMGKYVACDTWNVDVALDRECRIFWCTAAEWDDIGSHYEVVGGRIVNRHTGRTPACIHVPMTRTYRHVLSELWEAGRNA
ncbi:MAG: glycosyltransferase domain-containing protein [Planctomycetota bacterium]|jgi:hypothetical protein